MEPRGRSRGGIRPAHPGSPGSKPAEEVGYAEASVWKVLATLPDRAVQPEV